MTFAITQRTPTLRSKAKPKIKVLAAPKPNIETMSLPELVDTYADLKAKVDDLSKELETAKQRLIREGAGTYTGTLHNIVLSEMPGRVTTDMKALVTFLKVPQTTVDQFTKVGNPFYQLKVTGR